jgi:DNA-binding transcriptional MerR regulator
MNKLASLLGFTPTFAFRNRPDGDGSTGGGGAGAAPAAPATPKDDGDFIRVPRKDYDELVGSKAKVGELSTQVQGLTKIRTQMHGILRGNLPDDQKEVALREVMQDAGYSPEEINRALKAQLGGGDDEPRGRKGQEPDERDEEMARLRDENKQILEQQRQTRLRELRGLLKNATVSVFENQGGAFGKLIATIDQNSKGLEGEDFVQTKEMRKMMMEELEQLTTAQVSQRRQREGTFDEAWFEEEAAKVGEKLARKYRPLVITLPSKIGRGVETDGETDVLLAQEPKKAPVYAKGLSQEDGKKQVTDWAADMLMREAAKDRRGQPSAV